MGRVFPTYDINGEIPELCVCNHDSHSGPVIEAQCNPQPEEGNTVKEPGSEGHGETGNRSQGSLSGPVLKAQCNLQPREGNNAKKPGSEGRGDTGNRSQGSLSGPVIEAKCQNFDIFWNIS